MGQEPKEAECTVEQNSYSSSSGRQWQADLEEQRVVWSSSERKVVGAVQDHLEDVPMQKWT